MFITYNVIFYKGLPQLTGSDILQKRGISMKNKYYKRSHISEAKFREILRLLALDLTATQITEIVK